ncbi:MAG TPA: prephenate dehydrogenase/arogenate dehydrogenase family protein [Thermoanaerobaculia bacterium]|nr:prephenate dehydrogenase/arogenate dehydrogenase family protein [Thermoanaerobaculia bacterium]
MRALIVGLGLIGGSIGIRLRARGWFIAYNDYAVDLDTARGLAAADEKREEITDGDFDLAVLATPVDVAISEGRRLNVGVVTSVCSVMGALREAVYAKTFVAGHPMAGSHEQGIHAAKADLFEGKKWFVDSRHPLVDQMIRDCGATMMVVDSRKHDQAVAATSHLPQLLSTALASYLNNLDVVDYAGSGLRDFLRLANSHPSVWLPVFAANHGAIARHLDDFVRYAQRTAGGDRELFFEAFDFLNKLPGE